MTNRLFVQLKSIDDEQRIIEGLATSNATDRVGDIVDPKGAKFKLPMSFLWQHDKDQPLGHVIEATVTDAGIRIKAKIKKDVAPYIEEKWALIKSGLVAGLSIGFRAIDAEAIKDSKTYGMRFKSWEWLELSAVTIAANQDASIETIKALDDELLAVAGARTHSNVVTLDAKLSPGGTGKIAVQARGSPQVKTTAERIVEFEAKHLANKGRMTLIMEASNDAGRTLEDAEQSEFDSLEEENTKLIGHIVRLKKVEDMNIAKATPITQTTGMSDDLGRSSNVITVQQNAPKGQDFVRYIMCLAKARGDLVLANELAKQNLPDSPRVLMSLKAAMAAGTTTDSDWAKPLVEYQTMSSEFIELMRPMTIIGKMTQLRRVPFNIRVASQTQGSTVGWVGEGASKPVSELKFAEVLLGWAKAAGIVVITRELARFSDPSAEALIGDDLRASMTAFLDAQFIDPAVAAVANVHPAAITNGVVPIPSTGGTIADITLDLQTMFANLAAGKVSPTSGIWVTTPAIAIGLTMARTSQDIFAFPTMSMTGGSFQGYPVIVSESVPTGLLIFVAQREVFLADDGSVSIDASEQASLQLDSAPTTPPTPLVSLWQQNLVAIRAERYINWAKRNAAGVQIISAFSPVPGVGRPAVQAAA